MRIRTVAIACFVYMLFSMALFSKPVQAHVFSIGIEGGLAASRAFIDPDVSPSFYFGPLLGLAGDVRITEPWYIGYGVQWLRHGSTVTLGNAEADIYSDYLTVPVLLKWIWILDNTLRMNPFFYGGFKFGFNLNTTGKTGGVIPNFQEDLSGQFKLFDIGAALGAGLNYDLTDYLRLFARGAYAPWLRNQSEDTNILAIDSWRNQDINVTVGLLWLYKP